MFLRSWAGFDRSIYTNYTRRPRSATRDKLEARRGCSEPSAVLPYRHWLDLFCCAGRGDALDQIVGRRAKMQTTLHELVAFPNLDDWFTNMWPQGLTIGPYTLNGYRHIGLMGDAWNPAFLNPYDVVRLDFDVIQVHDFNDGLEDLPDLVVAVGNGLRTHFFCPWCGIDQPAQKWDEVIRPPWSDNTNLARSTILHLKKMEHRVIRKLLTVIIVQLARAQQANVGGIDQQQQQDQALLAAFPGNLDAVVEQQQEAADFNVDDFENLLAGGGLPPLNPDLFDAADQQQFLNWGQ